MQNVSGEECVVKVERSLLRNLKEGVFITEGRIGKVLDFLRIFRVHTTPATVLLVVPFLLLGGSSLSTALGFAVFLWSILVHWFGYGENSVMDFYGGFDQGDMGKQHFPLVSGRVSLNTALMVVHTLGIVTAMCTVAVCLLSSGTRELSLAFFLLALACGHAYNDGLGKCTVLKFIPLTGFAVFLSAGAYFLSTPPYTSIERILFWIPSVLGLTIARQTRDILLLLGLGYVSFGSVYQIAWLGELKEIQHPKEANLLRKLGCRVEDDVFNAGRSRLVGDISKILQMAFGFAVCSVINHPVSWVSLGILAPLALHLHNETARKRKWDRNGTLTYSALVEVCSILLFPFLLSPVIGFHTCLFLTSFSLLWFVIANRALWGTTIRPQV